VKNARTGRTYGGRERQQLRGQLLWLPGPSTEIRLIGDYVHHRGTINGPVYRVVGATGAVIEALSGVPLIAYDHAVYRTQIDDDAPRFEESDILGATLAAENQTVIGELTLLASARRAEAERSYDVDNGPADIANDPRDGERFEDYTVELRLQGVEGRVDYLIGVHAARQTISSRDSYTAGSDFESYIHALSGGFIPMFTGLPAGDNFPAGTGVDDVFRQRATSFALFTHEIFALGDRTDITLGARYTWEEKSLAADIESDNPGCAAAVTNFGPSLAGVPAALQGVLCIPNLDPRYDGRHADERNEGNWSGVAALSHQFSDAVSAYAQYSRGYKAGGYQLDRSGMNPIAPSLDQVSYSAEIADSFEAGMHGASMDGRWRFGAAIFHTSFNDYQFSYFTGLNRRTQNVPELVTKGVEFEGKFSPVMALEFAFALAYQKVRFGDSGFPSGLAQLEGTIAPLAPRWVVAGSATYRDEVQGLGLTLLGNVDIRWQSRSDVGASATPTDQFSQAAYATVGARIGVMTRDEGWRLDFWGRNIFDKRAWSILNSTTLQPGSISGYVADPQTFGIAGSVAL
jgi:outer membrane receptor protein involved in Fe transport